MEKERLRFMLENIQMIKSELYVGTKDAYQTLKGLEVLEETPGFVAKSIYDRLRKIFPYISYEPTPIRITGLVTLVDRACEKLDNNFDKGINPRVYLTLTDPQKKLMLMDPTFFVFRDRETTTKRLYPYFANANRFGCNDDLEFSARSFGLLLHSYGKIRLSLKPEVKSLADVYMTGAFGLISESEIERNFSQYNLNLEMKNCRYSLITSGLSDTMVAGRLLNDNFHKYPEYRRQLIARFIERSEISAYPEGMDLLNEQIERRMERLKKSRNDNAPDVILKQMDDLLQSLLLLRSIFSSDKNFIERYLSH